MFKKDERGVYRVLPWAEIGWLEHGFGTRLSEGWFPLDKLTILKQIHSNAAIVANGPSGCVGQGDALLTSKPGVFLGIRTADCLPILLLDRARRVVAAIHAGWRGTVQEVAPRTLARLREEFGCHPSEVEAAIGPAIGVCCYEVGPEVATCFRKYFPERDDLDQTTHLDLTEANRRQLAAAGVAPDRIYTGAPCTCCSATQMHSWRRDGKEAGRMYSVIGVRETPRPAQQGL